MKVNSRLFKTVAALLCFTASSCASKQNSAQQSSAHIAAAKQQDQKKLEKEKAALAQQAQAAFKRQQKRAPTASFDQSDNKDIETLYSYLRSLGTNADPKIKARIERLGKAVSRKRAYAHARHMLRFLQNPTMKTPWSQESDESLTAESQGWADMNPPHPSLGQMGVDIIKRDLRKAGKKLTALGTKGNNSPAAVDGMLQEAAYNCNVFYNNEQRKEAKEQRKRRLTEASQAIDYLEHPATSSFRHAVWERMHTATLYSDTRLPGAMCLNFIAEDLRDAGHKSIKEAVPSDKRSSAEIWKALKQSATHLDLAEKKKRASDLALLNPAL